MAKLSIITPTYNRANLLTRCFESLQNQSNHSFEWIVIDDGSIDETRSLMESLVNKSSAFSISYRYKENGGKHAALNSSHDLIHGDFVLILDSDDSLSKDAVQTVLDHWEKYEKNDEINMLIFLKQNIDGQICSYVEKEGMPADYLHTKRVRIRTTDCCEVIRSNIFKKYPFPIFENEKYVPETALWFRAAFEGKCVYINKPVYICEYLEGGLTKSGRKLRINNPKGGMYISYLRMNEKCLMKERIKGSILFTAYGLFAKEGTRNIFKSSKPYYLLSSIGYVPGFVTYLYWRKKYGYRK